MARGVGKTGFSWQRATCALVLLAAVGIAAPRPHAADDQPAKPKKLQDPKADEKAKQIRTWFLGLSSGSPTVREDSRKQLIMLTRKDLPALRDVVRSRVPLLPCESQPLRDIVTHVYLSGADLAPDDGGRGFVGVYFDLEQDSIDLSVPGVEIRHRMPGCCAYRYLEDGDVVLAIGNQTVHAPREMTSNVIQYSPGQTVTFEIFRRGKLIHVPVVLGTRPKELANAESIPEFLSQRLADANGYWDANFEPILNGASRQATAK